MDWSGVFIVDTTGSYLVVGKGSRHFDPTTIKQRAKRTTKWQPTTGPRLLVVLAPLAGSA